MKRYLPFVIVVGVALAALGLGADGGSRVVSGLVGLGLIGYGVYLEWFQTEGTFQFFPYVLILPFITIYQLVRSRMAQKKAASSSES